MPKSRKKFYGVREGRIRGVYNNWQDCRAQVDRCKNDYRGFETYDEAAFYVATGQICNANNSDLFANWKCTQRAEVSPSNARKEKTSHIKTEPFDSSQSFFSQVANFKPDDEADFEDEFGRFASSQNIAPGSKAWREKRTDAISHEVVFHYSQRVDSDDEDDTKGEDEDDLGFSAEDRESRRRLRIFQNMCREAKLEPLDTIDGCTTNLKGELINIVDYVDARRNGKPIQVWPPHQFEEFRRYTLSDSKRIDRRRVCEGDGILIPLLQFLRRNDAAKVYQRRRDCAVTVRRDCVNSISENLVDEKAQRRPSVIKEEPGTPREVISIHGTESDCSPSPGPVKDEMGDIPPWSPSSIGSSIVEILVNSQTGIKRDLHEFVQEQEASQNGAILSNVHKRPRL
ncbi:hypothetical protein F5Y03DRAFT_383949 [Xylaria venustula]|nr:hypothetical protein F5Y03DRAFT_383949 [Xylaria venustula]